MVILNNWFHDQIWEQGFCEAFLIMTKKGRKSEKHHEEIESDEQQRRLRVAAARAARDRAYSQCRNIAERRVIWDIWKKHYEACLKKL